jgi:hypothetical protein
MEKRRRKMTIEKLVVKEFEVKVDSEQLEIGNKFSYFVDPVTDKVYRPVEGFEVTGENLMDRFVEVGREE